jgi:hypothetical protein
MLADPACEIFIASEKSILTQFGLATSKENKEGHYSVSEAVLFYLPHCPKQLINNLLWSNWDQDLTKITLIGNSLKKTVLSLAEKNLEAVKYLKLASEFISEAEIKNNFHFSDIFNDLSLQWFDLKSKQKNNISRCSKSPECPKYSKDDLEFIQKS